MASMFGYQVPGRFLGKKNNHSSSSVYSDVRIITNKYTNNASMIIVRITVAAVSLSSPLRPLLLSFSLVEQPMFSVRSSIRRIWLM